MTAFFLDDGGDDSDGLTWAKAYTSLASLIAGETLTAADTIYVVKDHLETLGGNVSYVFPQESGLRLICVTTANRDSGGTTADTTAIMAGDRTEGWTGSGNFEISLEGSLYTYGLALRPGSVANNTGADVYFGQSNAFEVGQIHEKMSFGSSSNNVNADILIGFTPDSSQVKFIDCTFVPGAVGQRIRPRGPVHFINLSIGAGVTDLFGSQAMVSATVLVEDSDLSVNAPSNALLLRQVDGGPHITIRNCKLGASQAIASGVSNRWSTSSIEVWNSDSADTNYRYASDYNEGTVDTETTIVRTGGAEHNGTQYSYKMVSSARPTLHTPLETPEFVIWNETVGSSITVTVKTTVATTALQDDEIWLEVSYLGTSGVPKGTKITDRLALFGTPADQTVEAEDWDSSPSSPQDQNLAVSFTPQEVGFVHCKVMLAKPSITVYVDPLAVIS